MRVLGRCCANNLAVQGLDDNIERTPPGGTQQCENHAVGPDRYFVLVERAAYALRGCVGRGDTSNSGPRVDRW